MDDTQLQAAVDKELEIIEKRKKEIEKRRKNRK